jgi:hypothetical protein
LGPFAFIHSSKVRKWSENHSFTHFKLSFIQACGTCKSPPYVSVHISPIVYSEIDACRTSKSDQSVGRGAPAAQPPPPPPPRGGLRVARPTAKGCKSVRAHRTRYHVLLFLPERLGLAAWSGVPSVREGRMY